MCVALALLCAGCSSTKKETQSNDNIKQEQTAPVLRDPFRPDHPTRQELEAEKERKELEAMEKKETAIF